ncbi:inner membrane transporter rhtA [Enterobacter cloacae]|uniref:Inner membrane transporter rhtA n=1 Tax=Enterobacter cloacae TaxID=550 RepID=A0A377M3W1_ENTCL|nr:inner membrane transporter rhtA [Enterobacter cloacae]
MPGISRTSSVWMPVAVILIAMLSIQSGASLAKSLFPLVGAPGVTALRIALGTLILVVIFKPWRLRVKKEQRLPLLFYGLALGAMNYMFYLSIQTIPLGIAVALEFTGPLAVALFSSRRPVDFIWVVLAVLGLWFLLPLGQSVSEIDLTGCRAGSGRRSLLGSVYPHGSARRRRARPGDRGAGLAHCRHHLCSAGYGSGDGLYLAVVSNAGGFLLSPSSQRLCLIHWR